MEARSHGKVAWALPGFWQQEPSPRARQETPQDCTLWEGRNTSGAPPHQQLQQEPQRCVCVAPTLLAWGWIAGNYSWELLLLLLLTLASGCPSPAWGLSVFFCSPFRVVSTLFPSRNQSAASFRNCGQHLKNQRRMETLWKITKMGVRLH